MNPINEFEMKTNALSCLMVATKLEDSGDYVTSVQISEWLDFEIEAAQVTEVEKQILIIFHCRLS